MLLQTLIDQLKASLAGRYTIERELGRGGMAAQRPMLRWFGTPPAHKRQVIYDGGHFVPRPQLIRETLDWLDRYLGPVRR